MEKNFSKGKKYTEKEIIRKTDDLLKICENCGNNLEVIETSNEEWIFEGKLRKFKIEVLRCLCCGREKTVRKEQ